jgi:hypothetical protein
MTRPLQIYMNEHELELLDAWARERGWTKSHAVRIAIRALTRDRDEDSLFRACGMIEGLPEDLSEHIDDYLEETFVAEKAPSTYRKRRRRR